MRSNLIFQNLTSMLASELAGENKEYEEIKEAIKMVIHSAIDKVDEEANKIVEATYKDIENRLDLECKGHDLDRNKMDLIISDLGNEMADIYADTDDKPISTVDYFKYALTQALKQKFNKKK